MCLRTNLGPTLRKPCAMKVSSRLKLRKCRPSKIQDLGCGAATHMHLQRFPIWCQIYFDKLNVPSAQHSSPLGLLAGLRLDMLQLLSLLKLEKWILCKCRNRHGHPAKTQPVMDHAERPIESGRHMQMHTGKKAGITETLHLPRLPGHTPLKSIASWNRVFFAN